MIAILNTKILLVLILLFGILTHAQDSTNHNFYSEFHLGLKYNFGPTETQAEIVGGYDTLSYDHKQHFSPGYKKSIPLEFLFGYLTDDVFRFEGTISYYKLDIGLLQSLNRSEYPFVILDMISLKASGILGLNEIGDDSSINISSGVSVGAVYPFSTKLNQETQNNFGIKNFQPTVQIFFEISASASLALNDNGLYLEAGTSFTLPWVIGSIGKLEMQSDSQYSIIRDEVILHSISVYLGIGYIL